MTTHEIRDRPYPLPHQRIVADGVPRFVPFACAIDGLAPRCYQCGSLVLRRWLVEEGRLFCSERCALESQIASAEAS